MKQWGNAQVLSKEELRKEITDCPFQIFPNEICKVLEALVQGVIDEINPDMVYSYEKMMTKGEETCVWNLRTKGTAPVIIEEQEDEMVDPLAILKVRLAKGEIDKETYEEIRSIISS